MQRSWVSAINCALQFCLVVVLAVTARAQVTSGTILGTVTDSAGQVVSGADVTITEVAKDASRKFTTDESGDFNAPFLIPGTYSVTVERQGFKRHVSTGIVLQVDQKARLDVTLEVGELSETTTVLAGSAGLVDTDSSELGEVIEERAVRELPLNGRNFAQLVYLAPGITPGQAGENLSGASTFNPRGASNFNALGHHANSNGWLVDGIDNNEYTFNTVIVTPSVESIREFKVLTGTFSAEFGRGAGVVSVSTKSGSNDFHGTLFEFLRNDVFDARNYFASRQAVPKKPPFRRNQFGFALSGPLTFPRFGEGGPRIWSGKNRTFFFGDYAGLREIRGLTFVNTVPTAKTRVGDFSEYTNPSGQLIRIYDPLTTRPDPARPGRFLRDPYPGNIIPANRINPVGLNVASIYPLPNLPGNFNNYVSTANRAVTEDAFTIRLDHKISDDDSIFARYTYGNFKLDAPQGQANCCLPTPPEAAARFDLGPFVAGIQNTRLKTQGAAVNYTRIFSPALVNEFRTGFARTTPATFQSDFGRMAAESLGIRGINVSSFTTGIPNINVADFTGLSGGPSFLPVNPKQTHYQFEDNVYWTRGNHQLKFGYRYIRRLASPFTNTDTRGVLNFGRNFTNNPSDNAGGSGLATLLTGYSTGGSRGFLLEPYYMTNQEHAAFFQDDFKVSDRLTLNLGVRYEIYQPDVEIRDRLVNFDPVNLRLIYAGQDGASRAVNKSTQKGNFGPRVGFAWDAFGKGRTIFRGGFGISHFPEPHSASNLLGQQVPYTISQNYSPEVNPTDFSRVPTIANPFAPISPIQPRTTAELNAANPRVLGHSFENLTPYAESWNLDAQRQLTSTLMWEIAYVGSRGIHLTFCYNPNEVQPGTGSQASRRLIQSLNNASNIIQCDPRNMSTYHSMQTKLVKRFSDGLQFLASYTFGKTLDYGGAAASGGGSVGNPQTVTDLRAGRGPAGYDVKHRAVFSYVYELPFGPDRRFVNDNRVLGAFIGGWQLSGITTFTTGRPFTVFLNTGVNNGAPSWPNRIGSGRLDNPDPALWFNPADFVAPPANTYGNSARGVLYAPGHINFDTSLAKNIPLREELRGQFRFDAFNLFNTPSFGFPNANIGAPTVGRITSTLGDNRILQFALKLEW